MVNRINPSLFSQRVELTTDFCYGFVTFPKMTLSLPGGIKVDLMKYWDAANATPTLVGSSLRPVARFGVLCLRLWTTRRANRLVLGAPSVGIILLKRAKVRSRSLMWARSQNRVELRPVDGPEGRRTFFITLHHTCLPSEYATITRLIHNIAR